MIEIAGVSREFAKEARSIVALQGIDLEVRAGECFGLSRLRGGQLHFQPLPQPLRARPIPLQRWSSRYKFLLWARSSSWRKTPALWL